MRTRSGSTPTGSRSIGRSDKAWFFGWGSLQGEDFYGTQHDGTSFILEPLGYALGNLNSTYERFDSPSTPAAELRVVPYKHLYVNSMVFAADRIPFAHNTTGFVPQFRGTASTVSEIGWAPGQAASSVRAFDTIPQRRGYPGLYQFGASFNPGKFQASGPFRSFPGTILSTSWRARLSGARTKTPAWDWTLRRPRTSPRPTAAVSTGKLPLEFVTTNRFPCGNTTRFCSAMFSVNQAISSRLYFQLPLFSRARAGIERPGTGHAVHHVAAGGRTIYQRGRLYQASDGLRLSFQSGFLERHCSPPSSSSTACTPTVLRRTNHEQRHDDQ